ncbi:MAG: oxidoreductase [Pseudoalteromonas sp.]|uniref:Gfo/Idh/MocA family protein n=1 Tax=Pseudoalteromonas sp. TaxID=53249 RepID=UPI000C905221|nr:Gfo/Idh/MocA family oxidoreductase [Pseudoalteromonas sp.]MAD02204.1 oxidoreductase [Pseudoalteromonas sp.]|tara:strand:+ start:59027 stop:59980 length:954 start_codon:yes stop_codon:yes gene_type:complete
MKNFALIGAAGYIAPRHMKAIKDTGNALLAAMDKNDSVGIIDSHFPEAAFFTEFEQFERFVDLSKKQGTDLDYVAIASPNYLHDSHIRFALRHGADAICEKPLVLNPQNIDELLLAEKDSGKRVFNILQLRLHPSIVSLKEKVAAAVAADPNKVYDVDLTYLTSRGNWYFTSWKGEDAKSGGIATNIGVHFYDMLGWVFGDLIENKAHLKQADCSAGFLRFKHANVRWFLSVNYDYIPQEIKQTGQRTYRSITVDGDEIEFSGGFTDLHTASYQDILNGGGFGLEEARKSIEIVSQIRNMEIVTSGSDIHPFVAKVC